MSASAPAVGESWAYRAHQRDQLDHVVVLKLGVNTPKRVLIRFLDDEFEGRQDWVPPARLKCPWSERDAFVDRERRWDLVAATTPRDSDVIVSAASVAFDLLIKPELATLGYGSTEGVVSIHDPEGLAALLGVDPESLHADGLEFEEGGAVIAPWAVTLSLARRAVERDPQAVLRHVEQEEADARRESVHGRHYPRRGSEDWFVSPEICVQADQEHSQPVRAVLREWCGIEPVDLRRQITELRAESIGMAAIARAALEALRRYGHTRAANQLERKHRPV